MKPKPNELFSLKAEIKADVNLNILSKTEAEVKSQQLRNPEAKSFLIPTYYFNFIRSMKKIENQLEYLSKIMLKVARSTQGCS